MKKEILILTLFLVILILPAVSSIEIQMNSEIPQGQTEIAKLEGNFLDPILKENIEFYRGNIRTSFSYDVGKINGIYYIYFQTTGKAINNYSISIKNVRYYVGPQISNQEISKNFTINSEQADFSVNKGFVVTGGNFSITVQNLKPELITISLNTEVSSGSSNGFFDFLFKSNKITENSFTLLSGETEEINIELQNITETTVRIITLSTENTEYEIPAYVIAQSLPDENPENESDSDGEENESIPEDNESFYEEKNESEDEGSFWDLFKKKNETKNPDNEESENEYEIIIDDDGNEYAVDNNGNVIDAPASSKTCSQLNGDVCSSNQICQNENSTYAKDTKCCLSSCVKKPAGKNSKIIGWAILGLILILIIWFKIKFSKTRRRKFSLPR